ncbi:unnamed protein product [Zymoseptoria tritici ST99CH_3D1]|nr:unnamed protein product [Zymoseptoria tritici ST99CH_3D1]
MDRPELGRWQLYKAAQAQVVKWLIQTAGDTVRGTSALKAHQLLDLARSTAGAATAVPPAIIASLQDVIDGRQSQANWHSQRSNVRDNENHQWFIELLIKVRNILLPCVSNDRKPDTKAQNMHTICVKERLANVFSLLAIEEPSDSPLGNKPLILENDGMGPDFALWCHIKDMNDVREFIKEAWLKYTSGELSIVLVSQLAEVGIGLMRIEDEKFVAQYPQFNDYWKLLEYFNLEVHGSGKTICITPLNIIPNAEARNEELIRLICPAAAVLLRGIRDGMKKLAETTEGKALLRYSSKAEKIPSMRILELEAYDFSSIFEVQVPELLAWIHFHKAKGKRSSNQMFDRLEFLCGMADYYDSELTPTWLVMACAIHLDLYEIIGDKPAVTAKAWLATTRGMKQQLDDINVHFAGLDHPSSDWRAELAPIFRRSDGSEDQLFVTKVGLEYHRSRGYSYADSDMLGKATSCIMGSPCVAGGALWSDRMAYHKVGICFANLDLTLFALANLYTAITKSNLLKSTWEDMHFLINTHKPHTPLVPKIAGPYDAASHLRHYLRSLGCSLAQTSKYTSSSAVPTHEFVVDNHCTALSPTSEFVVAITHGYHANDLLDTFDRGDLVGTVLTKLTAESKVLKHGTKCKKGKKGTKHQPQFTVTEVLSTFKDHMIKDELHLNFDYPAFYMVGEKIRRGLHDLIPDIKDHPVGMALWEIVLRILRDSATAKEPTLLQKAAVIVGDIINAPGVSNKFSKEARNASSGGITKSLAPNIRPYNPAWTAELWEYFVRHRHSLHNVNMTIASSSASYITFYDPKGRKGNIDRITEAAERFWHLWSSVRLRMGIGGKLEEANAIGVQRKDGSKITFPLPATMKSLGLRGFEGFGIPLLEALDTPMEELANCSSLK